MTKKYTDKYGEYIEASSNDMRESLRNNLSSDMMQYIDDIPTDNTRIYDSISTKDNFNLEDFQAQGVSTIIVTNNLDVGGSILSNSSGTYLFVYGITTAQNLTAGNPIISLNNAKIANFTVGLHNNGILYIEALKTNILMNFEHHTIVQDDTNIAISYDSDYVYIGDNEIEDNEEFGAYLAKDEKLLSILNIREESEEEDACVYFDENNLYDLIKANKHQYLKNKIISYVEERI